MSSVTKDIVVDASASRIWAALADVTYVHHWHPKVDRSPALTTHTTGVGAQRTCHFYDGTSVEEEVTLVVPEERIEIAIVKASMPIKNAVAAFDLQSLASNQTQVTVTMSYEMKMGPLGQLMDLLMVRRMMAGMLGEVLEGLRAHVVDGVYVGCGGDALPMPT